MDLKKEIKVGDYAIYKDSYAIICSDKTKLPLKIVKFKKVYGKPAVIYEDGQFDFLEDLEKAPSLLLELV